MTSRRMRVMPAPEVPPSNAAILEPTGPFPIIRGKGPDSLLCGECGQVLAENIHEGQLIDLFIHCGACGAMNDVNP
jgi:hypothetical protein